MSDTRAIERILREVFAAQGAADAAGLAKRAAKDFELDQRDRRIYEMRRTMTVQEIHDATGLSVQRIFQIQREQVTIKHARLHDYFGIYE